ncbi:uncharacterized protein LOC102800732 [Saccoglossus kowalevskii]|uniref:Uncharacterized protein LOC102800732 n=1 Tax=Saccoglossus kowalevskii TaxID=10224 RepID=A0ABM0M2V7_SACKO|nr:PREDICTED: uncharacterized protein LOC102800732 [Saccoglossus kowalevskii]
MAGLRFVLCYLLLISADIIVFTYAVGTESSRGSGKLGDDQDEETETAPKPKPDSSSTEDMWEPWEIAVLIIGVLVVCVLIACIVYQLIAIRKNRGPMVLAINSKQKDAEKSAAESKNGYIQAPIAEHDPNGFLVNNEETKKSTTPSPTDEDKGVTQSPIVNEDEKSAEALSSPEITTDLTADTTRLIEDKKEAEGINDKQTPPTYFEVSNEEEGEKPEI